MNTINTFSPSDQRISIFIGSSTESTEIAYAVKSHFDEDFFNVDVWDANIFEPNKSNLDNLLKFTSIYDCAILVFTADDQIFHRGELKDSVRHNLVFEYGLFLGRIGTRGAFIIAEDKIKKFHSDILTDLMGISVGKYFQKETNKSDKENIAEAASFIREEIIKNRKNTASISFLPSTSLAIGYFENFVSRICGDLYRLCNERSGRLRISYEDFYEDNTKYSNQYEIDFYKKNFKLNIVIPRTLQQTSHETLKEKLTQFDLVNASMIPIDSTTRPFPIYWNLKNINTIAEEGFVFYDFPTTLFTSKRAIDIIIADQGELNYKNQEIREVIGEKEIFNFIKALNYCIQVTDKAYIKKSVSISLMPED